MTTPNPHHAPTSAEEPYPDGAGGAPPLPHRAEPPTSPGPVVGMLILVVIVVAVIVATSDSSDPGSTAAQPDPTPVPTQEAATPTPAPEPAERGSPIVVALQNELRLAGYYNGPDTGVWDATTTQALQQFQADSDLPADGRYDTATDQALREALGTNSTEAVVELQTVLAGFGWYSAAIDGAYGPGTSQAVAGLQDVLGITADGVLDAATIDASQATCIPSPQSCANPAAQPTSEPEATTAPDGGGTEQPTAPGTGASVRLVISDGLDDQLQVTSCQSAADTDVVLEATTASSSLQVNAAAGTGSMVYSDGSGAREGSVTAVTVDAEGALSVTGTMGTPSADAQPITFTITGECQ